jgi:hypothetical protein
MSSGYVAGATSSWWVQRKVKREVERVLPTAVRNEVSSRVAAASDRALERTVHSPVTRTVNKGIQRVRPDIDITDRAQARLDARSTPPLSAIDGDLNTQPGVNRLRERARRFRS